jgi:hypothetical protein
MTLRYPSPEEFEAIKKEALELSKAMGVEVKYSSTGEPRFRKDILKIVFKGHGFSQNGAN